MSEVDVKYLKNKIEEYEGMIEALMSGATKVGVVIAGPFVDGSFNKYRVNTGNEDLILPCKTKSLKLSPDDEVVISPNHIYSKVAPVLALPEKKVEFTGVGWDAVGGLESQIKDIKAQIDGHLKNAAYYKEFGIDPCKGILLWGPPGCGKTLISKVIATTMMDGKKGKFLYVKGPELLNRYVGNTEQSIRNLFLECRTYTKKTGNKSILFIDEADALLAVRGRDHVSNMSLTVVPQFLSEMDGLEDNGPLVLLSTNLPGNLDPAVIREGRIDLKIEIKHPNIFECGKIFEIYLKKAICLEKVEDLALFGAESLYDKTSEPSGAMIKAICNFASQEALFRYLETKTNKGLIKADITTSISKIL